MGEVRRGQFVAHFLEPIPKGLTDDQIKAAYLKAVQSRAEETLPEALLEVTGKRFTVTQRHDLTRRYRGYVEESFRIEKVPG